MSDPRLPFCAHSSNFPDPHTEKDPSDKPDSDRQTGAIFSSYRITPMGSGESSSSRQSKSPLCVDNGEQHSMDELGSAHG